MHVDTGANLANSGTAMQGPNGIIFRAAMHVSDHLLKPVFAAFFMLPCILVSAMM
jgi:hypothetical protein